MGNRIAIERKPIPLGVILKGGGGGGGSGTIADNGGVEGRVTNEGRPTEGGGRSGNANGYNTTIEEEGPKKRGSYNSSLHVWRFFIDDNGSAEDSQVRHEPVCLNESFVFDRHQAYLALHIFSENAVTRSLKIRAAAAAAATPTNNIGDGGRANGAGGESNQSPTATIESLLSSSVEVFTPRGLASCLEEVFITSATDNNNFDDDSSTSSSRDLEGDAVTGNSSAAADSEEDEEGVLPPLAYNLYVWRGKDSPQLVQALALTKSFELEKALKKDGKRVLRRLFRGGDKVPLSSIFSCTHNNRHRQARATSTTLAGETAAAGDAEACASRRRSQRHDDDDDDDDSEEADVESDDEDDDDEKPYSRQHHLYRQLLKRRRLTRRGAAGGEAGENPDGGSNGSVPKLSIPQVKNLFQAPVSPSRHGRSRSASALDAIINAVSIEEPAESSSPVPMVTTTTTTTSPAEGSGHLTLADLGPRPITKSSSLTMPVIPTSSSAKKGKLKLPPIKTGGVSLSGSVLAVPMNSFSLSDLQSMQDKEQGGDSDIFNRAEVNQRQDKLSKYDSICSKITDQVYLGSQTVSRDIAMLKQQGVTHILNCAGSICPEYHPNDFTYRTLYLMDGVREDITCMLYDVIEWMDNVITSNGKIFVHCQQGVSRSSAMTIGYLMWKNGWGFERTHMFVKERRGVSSPNTGFICQLLELAKRLSLARSGNSREGGLRLYQVVVHTENDPDFVVAKLARKENLAELQNAAPSSSCYILQSPDAFFIWVGAQCSERFVQVAQRTVQRVQRFENATKIVHVVTQGQETDDFRRHLQQFTLEEVT